MAANVKTGRTRETRYCGVTYTVRPSDHPDAVTGKKQVWELLADGKVIKPWVISLSKCVYYIHEDATTNSRFPSQIGDGVDYQTVLTRITG